MQEVSIFFFIQYQLEVSSFHSSMYTRLLMYLDPINTKFTIKEHHLTEHHDPSYTLNISSCLLHSKNTTVSPIPYVIMCLMTTREGGKNSGILR